MSCVNGFSALPSCRHIINRSYIAPASSCPAPSIQSVFSMSEKPKKLCSKSFRGFSCYGFPCGFYTGPRKECRCTPPRIMKYINKISGPLLDRIDIHIEAPRVNPSFKGHSNGETPNKIRERVNRARDIQTARFKDDNIHSNARENRHIKKSCNLARPKISSTPR